MRHHRSEKLQEMGHHRSEKLHEMRHHRSENADLQKLKRNQFLEIRPKPTITVHWVTSVKNVRYLQGTGSGHFLSCFFQQNCTSRYSASQ